MQQMGRVAEAGDNARRSMDAARQSGFPGLEAIALACLGTVAWEVGDRDGALRLVRQAQAVPGDSAGGLHRALSQFVTMILTETGELASCREVGDLANLSGQLWNKVILDLRAGRIGDATADLGELLQIAVQTGLRPVVLIALDCCGHLCAATGRPAEAITMWAAASALGGPWPLPYRNRNPAEREKLERGARE